MILNLKLGPRLLKPLVYEMGAVAQSVSCRNRNVVEIDLSQFATFLS